MNLTNADLLIARDSIIKLFSVNLAKESRKKKAKDIKGRYNSNAFDRLLTETKVKRRREENEKKIEEISQKKKTAEIKKIAVANKKKVDEIVKMKVKKIKDVARVEKKQIEMKEKASKKRKRQKVKILKDLKKVDKFNRSKRRKLQTSSIALNPALQTTQTTKIEAIIPSPSLKGYSYS
jgi:hypothetical protein